jgi:ribose 5-phosphate isomerase B
MKIMKVAIGSDHGGFELKTHLVKELSGRGIEVDDVGCDSVASVDYPDYAAAVAEKVSGSLVDRGIVICMTGIGVSITANKFPRVRAALCLNNEMAKITRLHNDSNVLCLSQKFTDIGDAKKMVDTWLSTGFEGGRHERRVKKIEMYEGRENG